MNSPEAVPDEVQELMSIYLEEDMIPVWWKSSVPALGGRTPQEVWEDDPYAIRALIDAYGSGAYL